MKRELIVIVSMVLSAIVVLLYNYLQKIIERKKFEKRKNRIEYIQNLDKEYIDFRIIDLDVEKDKVMISKNHKKIIIGNEEYTRKDVYLVKMFNENVLFIVHKRKDLVYALTNVIFE